MGNACIYYLIESFIVNMTNDKIDKNRLWTNDFKYDYAGNRDTWKLLISLCILTLLNTYDKVCGIMFIPRWLIMDVLLKFFLEHNGTLFTGCSLDDDNIQWDS